jgi:hypothetical protein
MLSHSTKRRQEEFRRAAARMRRRLDEGERKIIAVARSTRTH